MIRLRRNTAARVAGAIALAVIAGSCITSTGVELFDLTGLWNIEEGVYVGELDATLTARLPALGTMDIAADGTFVLQLNGGTVAPITGQLEVDGNTLDVTIGATEFPGEVFIEDDRAVLRILGGVRFDFDGDGDEDPALLFLIMDRI